MIESPPNKPLVFEHRLHQLVIPSCSTITCATLPADVEVDHSGQRLSGLLGLLDQLLGMEISCREDFSRRVNSLIRWRLSTAREQPIHRTLGYAPVQPVAYIVDKVLRAAVETGALNYNVDGKNANGKRDWQ